MPRLLVGKNTRVVHVLRVITVALLDAQTTLGRQIDLVSIGSRWLIEVEQQKAAAVRRDLRKPKAHARICCEHFNVGWLG